jgi:hypothetical protein
MLSSAAITLLVGAITVAPESVPARGPQESIITVDKPGLVHLQTSGPVAPSCEVVDHFRGPFASAGVVGKTHCSLDLLLDAGTYKVRLNTPPKGKGSIALKVTPFTEVNSPTPKLEPGRVVEQTLAPQQQASFWLRVEKRGLVTVRVAGRTVGALEVWRDGQWRTDAGARSGEIMPSAGQPQHEWWIEQVFEPGDYLLTAYGANPKRWTQGTESNALSVMFGFPPAPIDRNASLTIPASGFAAYHIPESSLTALLSLPVAVATTTELSLYRMSDPTSGVMQTSYPNNCQIAPRAIALDCAVTDDNKTPHVLVVRGAPGTKVELQWVLERNEKPIANDGRWLGAGDATFYATSSGSHLVGTYELPADTDGPPLSCSLETARGTPSVMARDFLKVGAKKPFQRSMNVESSQQIWFEVTDGGNYQITTSGQFVKDCYLMRIDDRDPNAVKQVSDTVKNPQKCNINKVLNPGFYQLHLYANQNGIEKVRIAAPGSPEGDTGAKGGCLLAAELSRNTEYRLRLSPRRRTGSRHLLVRSLPLALNEALPIVLPANEPLSLPVMPGNAIEVRGRGAFNCGVDAKDGVCQPPNAMGAGNLVLSSKEAQQVTILRPRPQAQPAPLVGYSARAIALPKLPLDAPQFFDFDRNEQRSLLFEVKEAGLYRVETQGLLMTSCTMRTAIVLSLAQNSGGGRGRNCLIEQYLRPGTYLVTVKTEGESRGRASVALSRRAPREATPVGADGEAFFSVAPGELIQQRLTVDAKKPAEYTLGTTARGGAQLSCRFEDAQGWPLIEVPSPCRFNRTLSKGEYLWMQLPLTVESVRHTKLEKVKPPKVFKGNKVHAVTFNEWADVELRPSGKDEFFINLQAESDLVIALTNRMQGRLYLINPQDKSLKPVDVIPPEAVPEAPAYEPPSEESFEEAPTEETPPEAESYDEGGEGSYEGDGEAPPPPPPPPTRRWTPPRAETPALPNGHRIHLPAGPYKLITEHSQADVGIRYRLFVGSETLAPGFSRDIGVPGTAKVLVPQNGTLRLKTAGEVDVRCRLFDAGGRLVTEVSGNGDDWNCALAEPMAAGEYTLVLEDESQQSGVTKVSVAMPEARDSGTLTDGTKFIVDASVISAAVPPAPEGAVQEISLTSQAPFSCALEDASGAIVQRQLNVKSCGFLVKTGSAAYRARVWTLEQATMVAVGLATRTVKDSDDGEIKAGAVARVPVKVAGRYSLNERALCMPEAPTGVLLPCGPEASLEARTWLIGVLGGKGSDEELKELLFSDDPARTESGTAARAATIQRQQSKNEAIHLLQVSAGIGEKAAPSCLIEGGVRALSSNACVAASRISKNALARWWAPSDAPIEVQVTRAAAVLKEPNGKLEGGSRRLDWQGTTGRYTLPSKHFRLELVLPPNAWAIRVEGNGSPGDLCVATEAMRRCVLSGTSGEVVLYSPDESRAESTLLLTDGVPQPQTLATIFEDVKAGPGTALFDIASSDAPRALDITGAVHCLTTLPDGSRLTGCGTLIPPKTTAQVAVEHDAGALRLVLGAPDQPEFSRFGRAIPSGQSEWLPWAKAADLGGAIVDRSFNIDQDAVVHVTADSGVCSLLSGTTFLATEGLGGTCRIDRLLKPGSYRVLVRPFGRVSLTGTVAWTTEGVTQLKEGVGLETWVAPGETKLYTFTTKSPGKVGFGVQVPSETLECAVLDASQRLINTGCQQFLQLDAGSYVLSIRAPTGSASTRFKPVLAGLAGATREVPEEYLRDFFQRIGAEQ